MSCSPLFRRSKRGKGEQNELGEENEAVGEPLTGAMVEKLLTACGEATSVADWRSATVLEVGCGTGESTVRVAERWPAVRSVLGVDRDPVAVDAAFRLRADETLDFARADPDDPSTFERRWGSRFDWLLGAGPDLLTARDLPGALRNLLWCLRPGGRCALGVPASKPPDVHAAARKMLASPRWTKYFKEIPNVVNDLMDPNHNRLWFNHPQADRVYSALLDQVGYEVLHTRLLDLVYPFASLRHYRECLVEVFRFPISEVPQEKREAFIKELLKTALKKASKPSKSSSTPVWNLKYAVVIARRPEI